MVAESEIIPEGASRTPWGSCPFIMIKSVAFVPHEPSPVGEGVASFAAATDEVVKCTFRRAKWSSIIQNKKSASEISETGNTRGTTPLDKPIDSLPT